MFRMLLVAATLLMALLPAIVWVRLAFASRGRGETARTTQQFAASALQFLAAFTAIAILILRPSSAGELLLIAYSWPVLAPLSALFSHAPNFFWLPCIVGVIAMALVTGIFLLLAGDKLRQTWPTVAALSLTVSVVAVAEWQFHYVLVRAVAVLQPACIDAGSVLEILGTRSNFNLHAAARKDDKLYGWSFRQNNFYVVPESVARNVTSLKKSWFSVPYPSCGSR